MPEMPKFEIPDAMRDLAERNVEQARTSYTQFLNVTKQAQEFVAKSTDAVSGTASDIQARAVRYAQDNMDASFSFASNLARARDMKEFFEIQSEFAKRQMKTFAEQAQELSGLMNEAAQKAKR